MAQKMLDAGYESRALRMHDCSDKVEIAFCPQCGKYEITKAKLCRDRLCPVCSWRLAIKRFSDMSTVCSALLKDYPENQWSFLTVTVQNCPPARLGATLSEMSAAYNRMRQRKVFKNSIAGWARTVEVTFNADDKTMHPHFHVLIMWQPGVDVLHEGAVLLNHWIASVRDLVVSYKGQNIEDVTGKQEKYEGVDLTAAVLETFKYTQKASEVLDMPISIFRDFVKNMQGKRAVAFGGLVKEYMRQLHIKTDDEPEDLEPYTLCANCGNTALSRALYKWSTAERSYLLDPNALDKELDK